MHSFNTSSPTWPKGVCPKSWERLNVSDNSSFKFKYFDIDLAICPTSKE